MVARLDPRTSPRGRWYSQLHDLQRHVPDRRSRGQVGIGMTTDLKRGDFVSRDREDCKRHKVGAGAAKR
jgi:hypothetical protein